MTLQIKVLTGVTAMATTTLGGFGIYKFTEPKDVREALLQKQKTILNTSDSQNQSEWTEITSKENLKSGLKDFLGINEEVSDWGTKISDLKKKCEEALSVKKDQDNFPKTLEDAEKYCVKVEQ